MVANTFSRDIFFPEIDIFWESPVAEICRAEANNRKVVNLIIKNVLANSPRFEAGVRRPLYNGEQKIGEFITLLRLGF